MNIKASVLWDLVVPIVKMCIRDRVIVEKDRHSITVSINEKVNLNDLKIVFFIAIPP